MGELEEEDGNAGEDEGESENDKLSISSLGDGQTGPCGMPQLSGS